MKVKTVCIVGMGIMGSQIGIVCARAGYQTLMVEKDGPSVEKGTIGVKKYLEYMENKKRISADESRSILEKIHPTTDSKTAFSQADFIIEAVFEDMNLKKEIFRQMDKKSRKDTILSSNTSTLSITEMASVTSRPQRCIGTHFLIPAALSRLVEVVKGRQTDNETHEKTIEFVKSCGKDVVSLNDSPAFIVNRMYITMQNEAFHLLHEGVASAEDIDKACQIGLGMPLGPLAAGDTSGIDLVLDCVKSLQDQLGDKYRPSPLIEELVKAGRLGKKTGRGVYDYTTKSK
jgi:3-hydroxybutyryl-CoA dehydrogenase